MRNLFALLWKNQFFVLFILLEITSLVLLSRSYSYHGSLAQNTTSDITGSIFSSYGNITDYLSLAEENETLAKENARLRNMIDASLLITDTQYVYRDSLYRYMPAKVVSNSVTKSNNFIMINKGANHGIQKEMGVVSSNGVAGIVVGVSDRFSTIMSMLHANMRISARIKNSGQLVNVVWDNNDYLYGTVIDIPSHIKLMAGDSIITSGNSLIYPEGIMIGQIESHEVNNNKNLTRATLRYSTSFNSIKHLYIIENIMKHEQDSLLSQFDSDNE